ncbi:MAG: c-type cytochrome [Chloroflexi bacterium]|nr:c-type cytochrome [Chloroflexota bacterium]
MTHGKGIRKRLLVLGFVVGLLAAVSTLAGVSPTAAQPQADAAAGRVFWTTKFCLRCHGDNGEGGFGPDLAGRGLSFTQFQRAVRTPWGIMPAFTEHQVSDENIADLVAWFGSLRPAAEPGPWRVPLPATTSKGQRLLIGAYGCAQCHGATADRMRQGLGGEGILAFERFAERVYQHTKETPAGQMGNFSELRVPREELEVIWSYLSRDLGIRVPVVATMTAAPPVGDRASYSFTLENSGALPAGQVFIAASIPQGATLAGTPGAPAGSWSRGQEGGDSVPPSAVWLASEIPAKGRLGPFTFEAQGAGAGGGSHVWARWLSPTPGGDVVISARVASR